MRLYSWESFHGQSPVESTSTFFSSSYFSFIERAKWLTRRQSFCSSLLMRESFPGKIKRDIKNELGDRIKESNERRELVFPAIIIKSMKTFSLSLAILDKVLKFCSEGGGEGGRQENHDLSLALNHEKRERVMILLMLLFCIVFLSLLHLYCSLYLSVTVDQSWAMRSMRSLKRDRYERFCSHSQQQVTQGERKCWSSVWFSSLFFLIFFAWRERERSLLYFISILLLVVLLDFTCCSISTLFSLHPLFVLHFLWFISNQSLSFLSWTLLLLLRKAFVPTPYWLSHQTLKLFCVSINQ